MTQDFIGAAYDATYIATFWAPGLFTALLLGSRSPNQALPLGFILSAAYLSVVYTIFVALDSTEAFWLGARIIFAAGTLGLGAVVLVRKCGGLGASIGVMAGLTAAAVVARNVLRLDVRPQYSDQYLIGWISSYIQSGGDPSILGDVAFIKRSFVFPLILTVGREGTITISLISIVAILVIMATYQLIVVLTRKTSPKVRLGIFIAVMSLWATSSFFWAMFGYQNAHVLVALAVAVLLSSTFSARQNGDALWLAPVGAFVAGFVISQARIETTALALLLLVPMLFLVHRHSAVESRRYLVAFFGPLLGFFLWLVTTDAFVFEIIPVALVATIFVPVLALIVFPQLAKPLGKLLAPTILSVLIALAIWYLFVTNGATGRRAQFFMNTFLGDGMWGFGAWAFVLIVLITSLWRMSRREILMLWATAAAILFTIDVKIIDGLIELGRLTGFGRGWTDSTNRAFFHLFAPITAVMVTGIIRALNKDSVFLFARKKNRVGKHAA